MYFQDREDAAIKLSKKLLKFRGHNLVVFALPRGGVILGKTISQRLKAPLDLIIPRKIPHPLNSEYAIGAISESGKILLKQEVKSTLDSAWLEQVVQAEMTESRRRRELYLRGKKRIAAQNRICILVDDGMATGMTMEAAILDLAAENPKAIIAAVPIAPLETVKKIQRLANNVITVISPKTFLGSISAYYQNFPQLNDREVINALNANAKFK